MSSTAMVLPLLAERDLLNSRAGRDGFAVLLFQDLAFIPFAAALPLLADAGLPSAPSWPAVLWALGSIAVILVGGRFLLHPAFRAIGGTRTPELFTLVALLTVAGAALLAEAAGLSASMGAFMAGVLLSESEFRHELEADIGPFEGVLLGFFFISVGMAANLGLLWQHPATMAAAVVGLVVIKAGVVAGLARLTGMDRINTLRLALALPQGSEFSFVLFTAAVTIGALSRMVADAATLVIALSMVATPLLFAASERLLIPRLTARTRPAYDQIDPQTTRVILCGFGRVGQIIGRILRMQGIAFTALDNDAEQITVMRRFGTKVYFGDATRPDMLRAAGAEQASVLIVAMHDVGVSLRLIDMARRMFPHLKIIVRARNRRHVHTLMDRHVAGHVRDTFHSSLKLSEMVLRALDVPADRARRAVALFQAHDEQQLHDTHAIKSDEAQLIQTAKQAADELAELFAADQADISKPAAPR